MKRGFTLIELLVVVLIIGILSAVALPQYRIAVEKTKISEANIILKSLTDACTRYCLENACSDEGAYNWDNIDIELNGMAEADGGACRQGKNFYYCLDTPNIEIWAGRGLRDNDSDYYINYRFKEEYNPGSYIRTCFAVTDWGAKVCSSVCGKKTLTDNECEF
ncbi:MAG: prepilin-type N-terminal cleavage/methylation domain-containing protein [Elusimicrobiaceae bacterium]|nr:prepilin-type N-terminal cleavage/methylation domain-containing protein [Elusimicrobiaceae bacterium]